jgi:hypothetical protein
MGMSRKILELMQYRDHGLFMIVIKVILSTTFQEGCPCACNI